MTTTTAHAPVEGRLGSFASVVGWHLAPGVPSVLAYVLFARILTANGLPNFYGLVLAVLLVEVPFTWWLMVRRERAASRSITWRSLFPWSGSLPWRTYVLWGIPFILFGIIVIGFVNPALQEPVVDAVFPWVPEWLVMSPDVNAMLALPRPVLVTGWILSLFMLVGGGFTQEMYFRGYLLPRMTEWGRAAPVLNAAGFAVFHLAAPWAWFLFFIETLPWPLLMWWKRSVRLPLFIHLGVMLFNWTMMSLVIFGVVQLPPGA